MSRNDCRLLVIDYGRKIDIHVGVLDADDLCDVCGETKSLFDSLETKAIVARRYRKVIAQRPELRKAHADCIRAYREICAQYIGLEK
jgi:hypothetical protein